MTAAHVSPYCGSWYPDQPRKLTQLLDEVFAESCRRTGSHVNDGAVALVVPHAAPCYSGTVAAAAYRHLASAKPRRVFILGFSHSGLRRGIAVPLVEHYRTPLGDVAVDVSAAAALSEIPPFRAVEEPQACDHSVEIQIPFLQRAAPDATVIPLYVGGLTDSAAAAAADALARARRPGDVLIASSDLTHYGPRFGYVPFPDDTHTAVRLELLDRHVMDSSGSLDASLFLETLRQSESTVCGYDPISLLLRTLRHIDGEELFQETLDYQTSGDITGDFHDSVSYGALGYFPRSSFDLTADARRELARSARATLDRVRETGCRDPVLPRRLPELERRAAVFVSLHHNAELLGCIGRMSHCLPLAEAVPEMTLAAALDDPRGPQTGEIPAGTEIEISVLTPMKLVRSVEAIRLGIDGIYLECGAHRGLLLPQVAEPGWTAEKFFALLLRKAGLTSVPASPQLRLFTFQAQVFHDAATP